MQIIHDEGFGLSEKIRYKPIVHSNTIQSLLAIFQAMEKLEAQLRHHKGRSHNQRSRQPQWEAGEQLN